jgi:hypothetical protein
MFGNLRQNN